MKCLFCSHEFDEASSRHSCSGCFNLGGCSKIRCPRCGYEMLPEPKWAKHLKKLFKKTYKEGK